MSKLVFPDITITKVISAVRLINSPVGVVSHQVDRIRWAVILKRQGETLYTANGKQFLSDSLHPVLMPKGCSYSWKCLEAGECVIIEFDALERGEDPISLEVSDSDFISAAFEKIDKSLHSDKDNREIKCKHLLYGMLYTLSKPTVKEYIPKDKVNLLKPAAEYISENYFDSEISNDMLASLCGISTVYFRKTFETVYGIAPIKYLHKLRIDKAKEILQSDYDSIGQVAESVGYSSIYHFSKMFKLYTGLSPSEYNNKKSPRY